jgi:hypothetical protein
MGTNPCLPAKLDPRVGAFGNIKIYKHFGERSSLRRLLSAQSGFSSGFVEQTRSVTHHHGAN